MTNGRGGALRPNRSAVGETYQALAAVTVVIVCAGIVLGAAHWAMQNARGEAAHKRAELQATLVLEALDSDPVLEAEGGALSWNGAVLVASGLEPLSFRPSALRVLALRAVDGGPEIMLVGDLGNLSSSWVFSTRAVLIEYSSGERVAGMARAGVELP